LLISAFGVMFFDDRVAAFTNMRRPQDPCSCGVQRRSHAAKAASALPGSSLIR
jgi:hypothetical protein